MKQFDILIAGNYFCDVIFSGLPNFPALGTEIYTRDLNVVPGGVLNTVVALRRLGVNVGWVGTFGTDFFSQYIRDQITREGVDTSLVIERDEDLRRVTVALSYPEDRTFVSYTDAAPDVVEMLLSVWDTVEFKHLHFSRLTADERLIPMLRECRERGVFITMDCQHRSETLELPLVQTTLSLLDIFMPNAGEAMRISGKHNLKAAAQTLLAHVPWLVVKDGANGVHAFKDGRYQHAPALAGMQVVDTTGAGDAFNAGFLAAHITQHDLSTCLRWGNICGGLSTQGYGGYTATPTLDQLQAHLGTNPSDK